MFVVFGERERKRGCIMKNEGLVFFGFLSLPRRRRRLRWLARRAAPSSLLHLLRLELLLKVLLEGARLGLGRLGEAVQHLGVVLAFDACFVFVWFWFFWAGGGEFVLPPRGRGRRVALCGTCNSLLAVSSLLVRWDHTAKRWKTRLLASVSTSTCVIVGMGVVGGGYGCFLCVCVGGSRCSRALSSAGGSAGARATVVGGVLGSSTHLVEHVVHQLLEERHGGWSSAPPGGRCGAPCARKDREGERDGEGRRFSSSCCSIALAKKDESMGEAFASWKWRA